MRRGRALGDTLVKSLRTLPIPQNISSFWDKRSELHGNFKGVSAAFCLKGTIQAEYDGTVESVYVTAEEIEGNSTDGYSTGASIGNGMASVQGKSRICPNSGICSEYPTKRGLYICKYF